MDKSLLSMQQTSRGPMRSFLSPARPWKPFVAGRTTSSQ